MQKYFYTILFIGIFYTSCKESQEANPPPEVTENEMIGEGMISVLEAKELLKKEKSIALFEVSKRKNYEEGHLPGAIQTWRPEYGSKDGYEYGGMRASRSELADFLSEKGVRSDDQILLYDIKGSCDALRLAFLLKMYGHTHVKVIDGGKTAWQLEGYPLTKEESILQPSNYEFTGQINESRLADFEMIKNGLLDSNTIIVDTREPEEYLAKPFIKKGKLYPFKNGAFAAGCIPTAIHFNWSNAVNLKTDHCIKSLKDLRYDFEKAGITPDKNIIVYCHSGVRSAHTMYVLSDILGYPNVRNYDGSWIEWSFFSKKENNVKIEKHTSEKEHERLAAVLKTELEIVLSKN